VIEIFLLLLDLVSLTNWVTKEDRLMSSLCFVATELLRRLWILMVSMRRCYKGQWFVPNYTSLLDEYPCRPVKSRDGESSFQEQTKRVISLPNLLQFVEIQD